MLSPTVTFGKPNSLDLEHVGELLVCNGRGLVRMLLFDVCGTDLEIIKGKYGWSLAGPLLGLLETWRETFHNNDTDIKVVVDFAG